MGRFGNRSCISLIRLSSDREGLLSTDGSISVASVVESCLVSVSSLKNKSIKTGTNQKVVTFIYTNPIQ